MFGTGKTDKRNVTITVGGAKSGAVIPWQVIYRGTTPHCRAPRELFPDDWNITNSKTHWSTNPTKCEYLLNCISVHCNETRNRLELKDETGKALLIYDVHKTNIRNPTFYDQLRDMNALYKLVLGGQTGNLQPMDLYANGVIKPILRNKFNQWYTGKVLNWIARGRNVDDFKADFRWSILKPIHARWIVTTYHELPDDIMTKSFERLYLCSYDDMPKPNEFDGEKEKKE